MAAVVVGRDEANALVGELDSIVMRENLEPARIGEDGPVPVHEGVQAAHLLDQVCARTHCEMVRVGEHDLRSEVAHRLPGNALDRRTRADGHEDRGLDVAMRRMQDAHARMRLGILGDDIVGEQGLVHEAAPRYLDIRPVPVARTAANGHPGTARSAPGCFSRLLYY